jgi:hypothetical protein
MIKRKKETTKLVYIFGAKPFRQPALPQLTKILSYMKGTISVSLEELKNL